MSKNRKKKNKQKNSAKPVVWQEWIVQAYLFLMLGIFPLYYQNKYFNIGDAKYLFFRTAALGMLAALGVAAAGVLLTDAGRERLRKRPQFSFSCVDLAVLAYTGAAAVSWLLSPFRADAWIGSNDWYMGLLSQLLFAGIYFAVSRYGTDEKWLLWTAELCGAAVFLSGFLHRFGIDPLGLYEGLNERYRLLFLGTIGQATWYSSYLCVVLPAVMGFYLYSFRRQEKMARTELWLTRALLFAGFGSAVTQNSDSVYIGLGLAGLFLLWFAVEEGAVCRRYTELLLTAGLAVKFTGILQSVFPEKVPRLDSLSLTLTKGAAGWLLLAAAAAVWGATCLVQRRPAAASADRFGRRIRQARAVFYLLLGLLVLAFPLLMWLNAGGRLQADSGALQESGYLVWNDAWGNGRGKTWRYCARVFAEYPLSMKLFGCGPDALTFYSDLHHAEELKNMWGGLKLTNAHNEWFTALIHYGLIGAAAYLSVFAAAVARIVRNRRLRPVLLAAGASVLSYMGHNFFCYQQSVCTPLIFIVIGTAEYVVRRSGR